MMQSARHHAARAFTIVELFVVIAIILIVLVVAVPAFSSMIYSSERALAENTLRAAVAAARDLAMRSESGGDGAAIFLFEPDGRIRVVPAVQVGTINDERVSSVVASSAQRIERDVFAPAADAVVVDMPKFWMVRGYAPSLSVDAEWYLSDAFRSDEAKEEPNWLFPESGFYDVDEQTPFAGTARRSFMIRFEARTGIVTPGTRTALLVDPRPSDEDRIGSYQTGDSWKRVDLADGVDRWTRGVLQRPNLTPGNPYHTSDEALRRELIGNESNDTVLLKSVVRLSLYDERRLARYLQARGLNRETNSIYAPFNDNNPGEPIGIDLSQLPAGQAPDDIRRSINRWIDGDTNNDLVVDADDLPEARVFLIEPYTGALTEVER